MSRISLFLMIVAASAVVYSPMVFACGNSQRHHKMMLKRSPTMASAERAFERANFQKSLKHLFSVYPKYARGKKVDDVIASKKTPALEKRMLKLAAISTVRVNGQVALSNALGDNLSKATRLQWAERVLEQFAKHGKKDPVLQTYLAEAHALNPKKAKQAKKTLLLLSAKDLISDGFGYLALARLHHADQELKSSKAALSQCKRRLGDSAACTIKPARVAKVRRSRARSKSARN